MWICLTLLVVWKMTGEGCTSKLQTSDLNKIASNNLHLDMMLTVHHSGKQMQ
jgi:hypothetical protein